MRSEHVSHKSILERSFSIGSSSGSPYPLPFHIEKKEREGLKEALADRHVTRKPRILFPLAWPRRLLLKQSGNEVLYIGEPRVSHEVIKAWDDHIAAPTAGTRGR